MLTQAQIDALNTTIRARFNAGLKVTREDWRKVAGFVTSNGKSNTYEWLSFFPAFREWVGQRTHKVAKQTAFTVTNRKFENTLDIPVENIEDDNYGMYGDVAFSHGESVSDLMNDLVFGRLAAAFSETCYDGQYFFDTDHPVYPNEDGTGVAATVSNYQAGTGVPWMLLCTNRAPKPFYLQERVKPQLIAKNSALNSDGVFENDVITYGGRWRGEALCGFWQLAYGSKAALTADNFNAAFTAMMKVKGDGNRKLGIIPNLLVCGPDNQAAAEALLKAQQNANGASNTNYNKVELFVSPWIGS
jgi:phage major head subunit gpT-like protein